MIDAGNLFKVWIFLFGASIGSFLNVVILRLPKNESLSKKRSHCPSCGKLIVWYENIPILSYFLLRGRCSECKSHISWFYPMTEILFGFLSILLLPRQITSMDQWLAYSFQFSVLATFYCLFMIDLKHKILPNSLNLYLGFSFALMAILKFHWMHYVLGGLIGFGFPYLVTWIFYKLRGQIGLGGGDIKLFSALGIYLGPIGIFHNIFLSCFLGAILSAVLLIFKVIKRDTPVPFGPFILITATAQVFFPEHFNRMLSWLFL